jgi:O-antigen/teichoic acid export membrane protein
MINTSTFVIFPIMMLLAAIARPVIIVMITEKWADCIILLQLLCFALMWYPVHGINLNMLMVKGRSDLFLKLEIIKRVLGITVMCCSLPFGLVAFCGAQIVSSVLSVYINTWYTGKFYDFGFFKQMKDILPTLILGLIMFASVTLFIQLLDNMMLQIILGGLLGVSIYLGGAFLFKFRQIDDIKYLLNRK